TSRPSELFNVLGRHAAVVEGRQREEVLLRQASVAAGPLERPEEALALARQCLQHNPRSDAAFLLIEGLLNRLARWEELAALLRARLDRLLDPLEVARLHERLGVLERDTLKRPSEAAMHFQAVIEREPRSTVALEALRELFESLDRP